MWLMMQQPKPEDFVIATGETHTVREFLVEAFGHVGLDYKKYVKTDKKYFRPIEVNHLRGSYAKAKKKLGWKPKTSFKELVRLMVDADLELVEKGS
jgi:GDPmannose 4,6-dehydratase